MTDLMAQSNPNDFNAKLLKADLHGAIIKGTTHIHRPEFVQLLNVLLILYQTLSLFPSMILTSLISSPSPTILWRHLSINGVRTQHQTTHQPTNRLRYLRSNFLVTRSRTPQLVGIEGIIVQETYQTFRIVTPANTQRVVPKKDTIFAFLFDGKLISIFGNNIQMRSAERSVRKFKNKSSIDF